MAGNRDIFTIDSGAVRPAPVSSGLRRTLCSPGLCGSKTLTVYRRTVLPGLRFDLQAGDFHHVLYTMNRPVSGFVHHEGAVHRAKQGAGVLLAPHESVRFEASGSKVELLHMVVPEPPAAVEEGLPGGPGYFFDRGTLRLLSDADGGRMRRFCAESGQRRPDGSRLTPTNAIRAGEVHYAEGGRPPFRTYLGTDANPDGPAHCCMILGGRCRIEVQDDRQEVETGTLVYVPSGVPHRLRALDGPLDCFEVLAWRSFRTSVPGEEPQPPMEDASLVDQL